MESDKTIISEKEIEENQVQQEDIVGEDSFEISDEAKQQSRKFFKFGQKPKKEKRKFESFEIVKTFTPKEKSKNNNEFDKILEVSNAGQTSEDVVTMSSSTKKQKVKMKLRPRGKLILIAISVVIILLSSLTIANAVNISRLNQEIANLDNQITIQDFKVDTAIKKLGELTDKNKSDENAVRLALEKSTEFTQVGLYERNEPIKLNQSTNWFDKFCNFISKIFGG
ncbi:MAG: hypothetical protein ACI4TI_03465 [Christensenellales bacterium]